MTSELQTLDGSGFLAGTQGTHAFLVVHVDGIQGSRVISLAPDGEITFGRSRGATITVDDERISRMHGRLKRVGDVLELDDLGSRNGTRVNGERIEAPRRLAHGDEIAIGPITATVGIASALRRRSQLADAATGEARLAAEVDRAVRYRRPLTVALVRIPGEAAVLAAADGLRQMDLLAEEAGDDYLLLLPELGRVEGEVAVARLAGVTRRAVVFAPEDGTTGATLVALLRAAMRDGVTPGPAPALPAPVQDPAMVRLATLVERISDTSLTVLILGETGVGKEVIAEAIHRRSSRRDQPFIKLNCAAIPENLLESELFGHERGAFTGAERRKVGFFEAANGGTLFLDEIGDMPLALQAKLLRVLERKVITRVGATTEVPTDARLVAATHRDLDAEVRAGRFRADLLFRIGGFTLVVPPLRDRPTDILPLAEHFIATASSGRTPPKLAEDARAALVSYSWPGNVRELRNAVERALVLCEQEIHAADLPDKLHDLASHVRPPDMSAGVRGHLAEIERAAIVDAMAEENNNQTRTARRLGLSRRALIYKLEKYGLKPPPRSST